MPSSWTSAAGRCRCRTPTAPSPSISPVGTTPPSSTSATSAPSASIGPGSFELLQASLTNDLSKIGPGRAQYQHLLDEADASVLDDIIVWWVAEDRFDVMPNASNTARVISVIGRPRRDRERAVIAVQGPRARERLAAVSADAAAVGHFAVADFEFEGVPCRVAGTGYTGEDGVECAVPGEIAPPFWRAVVGRRGQACRSRCSRHPPPGGRAAPARPRARRRHHLAAGRPRLGRQLGQGPLPGPGGARAREDRRARAGACGAFSPRGVVRRATGTRFSSAATSQARSRAATTRRCSSAASPSASCLPETAMGAPVEIAVRGGNVPAVVVKPPFQKLTPLGNKGEPGPARAAGSGSGEGSGS